jgi:epoxyqueuosine reductase
MTEHIPKPETSPPIDLLTKTIRLEALKLGFTKVGFSQIDQIKKNSGLDSWLQQGHQGEMHWMARTAEKRQNPNLVLEQACSIISLGMNYYVSEKHSEDPMIGKISRYAWGEDYHQVLKKRLRKLANWIKETIPSCQGLFYSDTGPVMDKVWAHKAGVGWIGKHSNLISREQGSWLFLGEILIDVPLTYDEQSNNYCGTCCKCIRACPTGAIVAPYVVDSRLCISYLTIELRGVIPLDLRPLIGTRIFGCDDCQDVCPWNRFAQPTMESSFYPSEGNHVPQLTKLIQLTKKEFNQHFRFSPVKRCGYSGFLRNVAVALGNSKDTLAIPYLEQALVHQESLVRIHTAWALGNIGGNKAKSILTHTSYLETDPLVRREIRLALDAIASRFVGAVGKIHKQLPLY